MKVVVSPGIPEREPRIKLSNKIELPPKFRKDFNDWLLERFGTKRVYFMLNDTLCTHPNNLQALRMEMDDGYVQRQKHTVQPDVESAVTGEGHTKQHRISHTETAGSLYTSCLGFGPAYNHGISTT